MFYSITELFQLIDQKKDRNEFYYGNGGPFGIDYYIDRLTGFQPDDTKILWGYCEEAPIKGLDTDKKSIFVKETEILVFTYIGHTEDFEITRMEDLHMAIQYLYGPLGLSNPFNSDISLISGGQRLKYYVKDTGGHIMTQEEIRKEISS